MAIKLDLSKVPRERALTLWLIYHDIKKKELAEKMGVRRSAIARLINGERPTPGLIEKLVEYGIPSELMPKPGRLPGRPKGSKTKRN